MAFRLANVPHCRCTRVSRLSLLSGLVDKDLLPHIFRGHSERQDFRSGVLTVIKNVGAVLAYAVWGSIELGENTALVWSVINPGQHRSRSLPSNVQAPTRQQDGNTALG